MGTRRVIVCPSLYANKLMFMLCVHVCTHEKKQLFLNDTLLHTYVWTGKKNMSQKRKR
ncbi:unnamed protein product [Musa banksii]